MNAFVLLNFFVINNNKNITNNQVFSICIMSTRTGLILILFVEDICCSGQWL